MIVIEFVKSALEELKGVKWPTRKETAKLTLYVIVASFLTGIIVMGFDYIFEQMVTFLLARK